MTVFYYESQECRVTVCLSCDGWYTALRTKQSDDVSRDCLYITLRALCDCIYTHVYTCKWVTNSIRTCASDCLLHVYVYTYIHVYIQSHDALSAHLYMCKWVTDSIYTSTSESQTSLNAHLSMRKWVTDSIYTSTSDCLLHVYVYTYVHVYIQSQDALSARLHMCKWVMDSIYTYTRLSHKKNQQISEARCSGCICVYIYVQLSHGLHNYIYIWVTNCIQISEAPCWVHVCIYLCANESRTHVNIWVMDSMHIWVTNCIQISESRARSGESLCTCCPVEI